MMNRFNLCLTLTVIFYLTISANAHAANRLVYENFDDQNVNSPLVVRAQSVELRKGGDYTWATGRTGSGSCLYIRTTDDPDTTIPWLGVGQWPSNEMYYSVWMRYPSFQTDPNDPEIGKKFFYPHFNGTTGYLHYGMTSGTSFYYSSKNSSTGKATSENHYYGFGKNVIDGGWHHYEWYINFATGNHKFWLDGSLRLNNTYGPGFFSKNVYYISFPGIYQETGATFSEQWDDLEIWDGMPSNSSDSSTVSYTSGSTSGSTPPSISEPSGAIIIDNGDPNTEVAGSWSVSNFSSTYGANSVYSNENASTYSFEAACTGAQKVYLWYTASGNRCTNVPVEIYDGNTHLDTVTVNQQQNGGQWNELGTYSFSGNARIITTSNGGCITSADAVRLVPTSSTSTTTSNSNNAKPPPPGKPYVVN